MAALINAIQINYYKQQCQRTQRTNQMCAYSQVRSVVSQPKSHLIQLFSWIRDDGRAPATGIRRVNLEPTDGNISPVSVRSALFKVAGYPGNFSRRGSERGELGSSTTLEFQDGCRRGGDVGGGEPGNTCACVEVAMMRAVRLVPILSSPVVYDSTVHLRSAPGRWIHHEPVFPSNCSWTLVENGCCLVRYRC